MILILICLITVMCFCIFLRVNNNGMDFIGGFVAPFVMLITFVGMLAYCLIAFGYFAAEHKANIINREYNTEYTQLEVFYASDVIETVRELDRKRIELNGDLITGK